MEMVVVAGLFVIAFLVITMVLINAIKNQRQISAMQEALSETKIVLEQIARQARLNPIAYDARGGIIDDSEQSILMLRNVGEGASGVIAYSTKNVPSPQDLVTRIVACEGDANDCLDLDNFGQITSNKIIVNKLSFDVVPRMDPYPKVCSTNTDCTVPDQNPGVCGSNGYCFQDKDGDGFADYVQPTVTITIDAEAVNIRQGELSPSIKLQTTVTSRWYQSSS